MEKYFSKYGLAFRIKIRFIFLALLTITGCFLLSKNPIQAADTSSEPTQLEKDNSKLSNKVASDGAVLLQNKNNALPLQKNQKVALYGYGAYATVTDGTGSGAVNTRKTTNIQTGLSNAGVNIANTSWLKNSKKQYKKALGDQDPTSFKYADPKISQSAVNQNKADVGVYVLTRISGEGNDRSNTSGDYQLTKNETNNIKNIANHYKHSIVLLNTGGIIDTHFVSQIKNLDSVALVSQGGETAGSAVADILTGKVNPSGALTDSWAYNYSDYPSSSTFAQNDRDTLNEPYKEGIYVGYRYFDSYNKQPRYPFGFGKSYTSFSVTKPKVNVKGNQLNVSAQVKNTGRKYAGRKIVQLYYSAPKGLVPKAMQNLGAYVKTKTLKPKETQTVNLKMPISKMASFNSNTESYQLAHGNYLIRLGGNSRDTHVIANLNLGRDVTTQQLTKQVAPKQDKTHLKGDKNGNSYVPANQKQDLKTAKKINLNPNALDMVDGNKTSTGQKPVVPTYLASGRNKKTIKKNGVNQKIVPIKTNKKATLKDVYDKKVSLNSFVAGLSNQQLSYLVSGNQALKPANTKGTVEGVAGQTTANYIKPLGIPVENLSDGPAGLRITNKYQKNNKTYYQYATGWPIETLIAQTWDLNEIKAVGQGFGKEMAHFGISDLLAPALNIQRNPLGGRNFEYYAEDPLVSGQSAASMIKGVQSIPGEFATPKHFVANNQESNRNSDASYDAQIGQQALREIYLKGFQIAVQKGKPGYMMSSYNRVNGHFNNSNSSLLVNILRQEWGFKGTVMTDWASTQNDHYPDEVISADNALIMPGSVEGQKNLLDSVNSSKKGTLQLGYLQQAAKQILTSMMHSKEFNNYYHLSGK